MTWSARVGRVGQSSANRPETEIGLGSPAMVKPAVRSQAADFYRNMPMSFEANTGQEDGRVKYSSRGRDYRVFLTDSGATFAFRGDAKTHGPSLTMNFKGANREPQIQAAEKLPGTANYFIGRNPSKWKTNVATYARVKYEDVYPGIDLVYYGKDGQLEYDFAVKPSARASDIRILLSGIGEKRAARINSQGDLEAQVRGGELDLHRPVAYQRGSGGEDIPVEAHYVLGKNAETANGGAEEVALEVGDYDRTKPLIIDPVLTFSTFLGGASNDTPNAIAVDASGNVYVVGFTTSTNFPTQSPMQSTLPGTDGAFVTKINAAGNAILYSTYLGGSTGQNATAVTVDSAGNAYLAGSTSSSDFPTTPGAYDTTCNACGAAGGVVFVTKLNSAGSQLVYSTFLGGSGGIGGSGDQADAIAVDSSGLAYVTGGSFSTDFPTTPGSFQPSRPGGLQIAFVTQFNAAGSALNYSTYLGAGQGSGIAADASGNAYVSGSASDQFFPTTPGAFQTSFGGLGNGGGDDAFVTKLNPTGSALVYSSFLGGKNVDGAQGIAIDSDGNAYVTGQTFSPDFPVKNAFQATLNGKANAYITKVNSNGSALVYSTFFGGSNDEGGGAIAVDSSGNAYVTGFTQSSDFPLVASLQSAYGGAGDSFLTVMNANGMPTFSTFLGGTGQDSGSGVTVDSSGNAYLTGTTQSTDFPELKGVQPAPGGQTDGFVTKFSISTPTPPADFVLALSSSSATIPVGQSATFEAEITPTGAFNQTVAFTCSVAPLGPTCQISPTTVTSTGLGAQQATATVFTASLGQLVPLSSGPGNIGNLGRNVGIAILMGLSAAFFVLFKQRKPFRFAASWVGISALLLVLVLLQACGGGGGGGGGIKPQTYTVTVTGTAGSISHTQAFALTVQ